MQSSARLLPFQPALPSSLPLTLLQARANPHNDQQPQSFARYCSITKVVDAYWDHHVSIIAGNAYYCDVKVLLAVGFALVLWALLVIDCRLIELCIRAEAKQTNNDEQSADR